MRSTPPTPVETKSYLGVILVPFQNSIVGAADPAMVCVSKLGHSSGIAKQVQLGKSVWGQNVGHGTTRNKWPNCMIVLVLAKIDRLSSYSIVHMKCPGNHVQPLWVPCCLSHSSENALKEGGKLQEGGLWEGRCSNCTVSVSSDEVTTGLCWAPRF